MTVMNKLYSIILFLIVSSLFFGCKKEIVADSNDIVESILHKDIVAFNRQASSFSFNLLPIPSSEDRIGHKNNFEEIINQLKGNQKIISVDLSCYACIKTFPAKSEIVVTIDSIGVNITRVIVIDTPDDEMLRFSGIY